MDDSFAASRCTALCVGDASPDAVLAAFVAGFAGYQVPFTMNAPQLDARLRNENLDPFASTILLVAGEPVAILLIARRGRTSRVAAMGIAPAMRGTGLGAQVIGRAVSEATMRGDTGLVLEVIHDNVRAVKLYARAGFEDVRTLRGFTIDADRPSPPSVAPLREIDPAEGTVIAGRLGIDDMPWQQQLPSLAAMVRPTRCFVDAAGTIVAMVDASQPAARLRALACTASLPPVDAGAFTAALRTLFPDRAWFAPPLYTDLQRDRFFAPGGWTTTALRQREMRHPLGAR